ncbi:OsmC family protein [Bacillus sp. DTU_2020_1000418_1_SI_GHA_SEK_038]|uniref:OsmC family protein n=1 Tax=Bacillus sp. DTU_2020_1000418_1_SI_GHA_SEK_038 TaxID=3077585 RepID=UPI0028E22AEC|nr:OsmC family protein [Bacillus sp. DTU_2020_1000418_1_SI_GHA_SEK_038]WNS73563.1 OsmC family protein [Bacillus sp. DTU_2020_1000418_1_SI_GHA_SEK_038]
MAQHHFHLTAHWPGLRNDVGDIEVGQLKTKISIPPEMDGPGIGTNPDEMLLGAAATCYIITLAAMMEHSKLEKNNLSVNSTGIVDVTKGVITYKKIIHRPVIVLKSEATEKDKALALKLAQKAETSCMISRALKGNVEIELEATIIKQ